MSKILLLVCVVIVVIILYARMQERKCAPIPSCALSDAIDSSDVRQSIASIPLDTPIPKPVIMGLFTTSTTMSSDDLFAIATANMRIMEDMRDLADRATATSKELSQIRTKYIIARERARAAMTRAIAMRAKEDSTRKHAITTDVMTDRAREFNQHVEAHGAMGPIIIAQEPKQEQEQEQAPGQEKEKEKQTIVPTWSHDPENVHDSLVGSGVTHKINTMRADDQHITDEHSLFGAILKVIDAYNDEHIDSNAIAQRRANARHTLHVASANAHCSRYDIGDFDALRLVYERSLRADADENVGKNMRDALVCALAECSPNNSSVCLVGRITRYVGSLDVVEHDAQPIMNIDAHRATLFAKLGQMQVQGKTANDMREYVNHYFASDPTLRDSTNASIQKIKSDALAGIED